MNLLKKMKRVLYNPRYYFSPEYMSSYYRFKRTSLLYHLPNKGFSFPPLVVSIAPTPICNARCKMCDIGQKSENSAWVQQLKGPSGNAPLSIEDWVKLIDEISRFKPFIAFAGGEPFVYKNIIELCAYINRKKLGYANTTNGILIERYADDIVRLGMAELGVSITGPPKIHNLIAGVDGAFEKVVNGIKQLEKAKARMGKKRPELRINYPIFELNYMYLEEFAAFLKNIPGVSTVTFTHQYVKTDTMVKEHGCCFGNSFPISISTDTANPSKVDTESLIEQINSVKAQLKEHRLIFRPELSPSEIKTWYERPSVFIGGYDRCNCFYTSALIAANGDVVGPSALCVNTVFGNIREQGFLDIWNNSKYRRFRTLLKNRPFPICARCCGIFKTT